MMPLLRQILLHCLSVDISGSILTVIAIAVAVAPDANRLTVLINAGSTPTVPGSCHTKLHTPVNVSQATTKLETTVQFRQRRSQQLSRQQQQLQLIIAKSAMAVAIKLVSMTAMAYLTARVIMATHRLD